MRRRFLRVAATAGVLAGGVAILGLSDSAVPTASAVAIQDAEIYVVRPDGTGLRRLTRNRREEWDPRWSPDAQSLAYVRARRSGAIVQRRDLWVADARGRRGRLLLPVRGERAVLTAIDWSPDAREIVVAAANDDAPRTAGRLLAVNVDTRNQRPLSQRRIAASDIAWRGPAITYQALGGALNKLSATGAPLGRISAPGIRGLGFDVSRDGGRIVYVKGSRQLWTMAADGPPSRRRIHVARGREALIQNPSFSPDGSRVVFTQSQCRGGRTSRELYVVDTRDRSARRISRHRAFWTSVPDWGPQNLIAFIRERPFGAFDPCEEGA